jgi:hypothetical protein
MDAELAAVDEQLRAMLALERRHGELQHELARIDGERSRLEAECERLSRAPALAEASDGFGAWLQRLIGSQPAAMSSSDDSAHDDDAIDAALRRLRHLELERGETVAALEASRRAEAQVHRLMERKAHLLVAAAHPNASRIADTKRRVDELSSSRHAIEANLQRAAYAETLLAQLLEPLMSGSGSSQLDMIGVDAVLPLKYSALWSAREPAERAALAVQDLGRHVAELLPAPEIGLDVRPLVSMADILTDYGALAFAAELVVENILLDIAVQDRIQLSIARVEDCIERVRFTKHWLGELDAHMSAGLRNARIQWRELLQP